MIQDMPTSDGLYVAYINDQYVRRFAARTMLMWHNGCWWYPASDQKYRDHVYGCIGPLPALELEE